MKLRWKSTGTSWLFSALVLCGGTSATSGEPMGRPSTLDAQATRRTFDMDAVMASMVQRHLLADLRVAEAPRDEAAEAAAPPKTSARSKATGDGWRAAGSSAGGTSEASDASPARPALIAARPVDRSEEPRSRSAVADADEYDLGAADDDDLAPIDDFSEEAAPADDAPGDPIEPEYTGPAEAPAGQPKDGEASRAPKARPLSEAATLGSAPAGEPDRLARPSKDKTPPASPEDYQDSEPKPKQAKLRPLTRNQMLLRDKVRSVLKHYYGRPLNSGDRSPWEVMHSMLAFEVHSRILQGGPQGEPITAVGWLCFNQPCKNRTLMYLNEDGQMRVKVGPALQGHHGQLLALLAQARVRSDYPMRIDGKEFTVADLIEMEKQTCYPRTELTFKLIGLQRYLDIEDTWVNDQGMHWDFPTLIREEMRQPVRTAACGGTHRLAGLALAVKKRQSSGLPVDGAYAEAAKFVANYQAYAYRLQNRDGSFSTDWFKGPGAEPDVDRRLKTTGHTLELMLYAGSEQQLTDYRTVRAVNYLTNIMYSNRTRDWEAGPLGHAIHALVLYDRLVFSKYDADPQASPVAQKPRPAQR